MKRASWLKVINVLLFLSFLCQALTGLGRSYIPYDIFMKIHLNCGVLLVILALIHVWLNWTWIKNNLFKKKKL